MTGHPYVPDDQLDFDADLVMQWNGLPFTGIAFEESPPLGRSEVSYRDGIQSGPARDWHPSGTLRGESMYVEGVRHGMDRTYDESGCLVEESLYAYGVRTRRRTRGSGRELVESERLDPSSETAGLLERLRRERRWPEG